MFRTVCRPFQTASICRTSLTVAPRAAPITPMAVVTRRTMVQQAAAMPKSWTFSEAAVPVSTSKILAMAAAATATPLAMKKPVLCQAYASPVKEPFDPATSVRPEDRAVSKSLFHSGELTFGGFLGVCTGYLIKKVGKLFAMMVGVGFIFLQYCSSKGFVSVHWDRIEDSWRGELDVDRDGKVTTRDLKSRWKSLTGFLTQNLQFKSSFLVGFYAGIRYG